MIVTMLHIKICSSFLCSYLLYVHTGDIICEVCNLPMCMMLDVNMLEYLYANLYMYQ